ncbi:MAG: hypothetical protein Q8878_04485 [Bacillota bacterium]|nr:hypothetical protein [Bacillota bacterium]
MKRKLTALISLVLLICFLAACSNPVAPDPSKKTTDGTKSGAGNETTQKDTGKADTKDISGFNDDGTYAKDLNVYDSFDYDITEDKVPDKIVLYTAAKKDQNGQWAFDDGQEWALVAVVGARSYALFDRRYVQNGSVSYQVFKSEGGAAHVLVTCREGSGIKVSDFVYAAKGNAFTETVVYSSGTINLVHNA